MFPFWHCNVVTGFVVYVLCTQDWWVLGGYPPKLFDTWVLRYPRKQLLMGKQWSDQSVSYIKSKLVQVKGLPNLMLLAFCMLQILIFSFWRKLKCKSSKCIPQQLKPKRRFNTYSYTTYSHTLTYSLATSCRPTYCKHAIKMTSFGTIKNWLLNFLAEFVSPTLLNKQMFPFQFFFNFFDHIKCKNTKSFFFAINNSSLFNFTP